MFAETFQLLDSRPVLLEVFSDASRFFSRRVVHSGKMVVGRGILKAQVRSIGVRSVRVRLITTKLRADQTEENDRKTTVGCGKERWTGRRNIRREGERSGDEKWKRDRRNDEGLWK